MIICRTYKRVFSIAAMISQLGTYFHSHATLNKTLTLHRPIGVLVSVKCFRGSKSSRKSKVSGVELGQSSNSLAVGRVSRLARGEAQDVLFDYLHSTRNLHFIDAEHISKNSPYFVQKLLSKVRDELDIPRSLSKLLRYNPINEFEPFLESLGLNPSEIPPLLPRNLMFLSDDSVLLENYHVLCDYGIPRSKLGRMYKEAKEVFGYDYGILAGKLRAYELLGLTKSTVVKLVTSDPSLLIGSINSDFIRVFEKFKGLGIWNNFIGGYLSDQSTCDWKRMLDTLEFFVKVGSSEKQICSILKQYPDLLFEGLGKSIHILVGRLLKLGLTITEASGLFLENPRILAEKFVKNLWDAVGFLLDIRMEPEDITSILLTHAELLGAHSLKGPKTVLSNLKIGREELCQILKEDPLKFFSVASKSKPGKVHTTVSDKPSKHQGKTAFLLRLGYVENSDEMAKAFKKFRGRGDQLQERFDCLIDAGLDSQVVADMIKQVPSVLNQTKDVLEKKLDYLRRILGYPLESVVAFPSYLCYDKNRISLRFQMYVWLRERGAAKPMLSLSTILACSDARFVKYFVEVHPEGQEMWENLKKLSSSS